MPDIADLSVRLSLLPIVIALKVCEDIVDATEAVFAVADSDSDLEPVDFSAAEACVEVALSVVDFVAVALSVVDVVAVAVPAVDVAVVVISLDVGIVVFAVVVVIRVLFIVTVVISGSVIIVAVVRVLVVATVVVINVVVVDVVAGDVVVFDVVVVDVVDTDVVMMLGNFFVVVKSVEVTVRKKLKLFLLIDVLCRLIDQHSIETRSIR